MRFRVAHLLTITVFVAVFGTALANPTEFSLSLTNFAGWSGYMILAVRAMVRPKERLYILPAILVGLSYLSEVVLLGDTLASDRLLRNLGYDMGLNTVTRTPGKTTITNYVNEFVRICHVGLSFVFALIGGALGAHWSRSQPKAE